jgi:hypothetical protein
MKPFAEGTMSQDGNDPPLEPGARGKRPKLSVITGGGGARSELPEPPALARSSISAEGRDRVMRALRMLGGERAFLFVWDEREFTLSEACACDETGAEPRDRNVMWSLLDRITSQRTPLVMAGTDDQPSDALLSGVTAPLRMAIAVPLLLGDTLKGVACFDKRIHKGQFVAQDALAAVMVLRELGLEADSLDWLRSGTGTPARAPSHVCPLLALLRDLSSSETPSGLGVKLQLAVPTEEEICFWHAAPRAEGGARLSLYRLRNMSSPTDQLVNRLLTCNRSLSLYAESSFEDHLHGLAFELERGQKEPFELHATALELGPEGRTVSIWQAGQGALLGVSPAGEVRVLAPPSRPLARGERKVTKERRELLPGERVVGLQREGLFDEQGVLAADLAGRRWVERGDELSYALGEVTGLAASYFWLEAPG